MLTNAARMNPEGLVLRPPQDDALTSFETTAEDHFVLAHHGVARCSGEDWTLSIGGLVDRELRFTMAQLRARSRTTVTAVLECAGNPEDPDKPTRFVSNARWGGTPLGDLLACAGVSSDGRYVWLRGVDWGTYAGVENSSYLKDIPLHKAGDVLIAHEMNGEPLTPEHGYPLRAVVPGYYGTNSVKWLSQISVQTERPQSLFTTTLYNTDVNGMRTPVWAMAVNSRLIEPRDGDLVALGEPTVIAGWAWSEAPVTAVDISVDGGRSWQPAHLDARTGGHSWQRFHLPWTPSTPQVHRILARAGDATGAVQPPELRINQIQEITVTAAPSPPIRPVA